MYDRELVEDLDEDTSGWFGRLMYSLAQVEKDGDKYTNEPLKCSHTYMRSPVNKKHCSISLKTSMSSCFRLKIGHSNV